MADHDRRGRIGHRDRQLHLNRSIDNDPRTSQASSWPKRKRNRLSRNHGLAGTTAGRVRRARISGCTSRNLLRIGDRVEVHRRPDHPGSPKLLVIEVGKTGASGARVAFILGPVELRNDAKCRRRRRFNRRGAGRMRIWQVVRIATSASWQKASPTKEAGCRVDCVNTRIKHGRGGCLIDDRSAFPLQRRAAQAWAAASCPDHG